MAFGFVDRVIKFVNSGAGPITDGPYGGTFPGRVGTDWPVPVDLSVVLGPDGDEVDFLSLPTGSELIVGFRDEVVVDGPGDDIFITEVADNNELADVFVSGGGAFVLLGRAQPGRTASFDLADIGWVGPVTQVRIVGLDNGGSSPGFDVVNVRALLSAAVDLDEDNDLAGSDGRDVIDLRGGDDVFDGGRGADAIFGGAGRDRVSGGAGRDEVSGGGGRDVVLGGRGADRLSGDGGADRIEGGQGADVVDGGRGRDRMEGGGGRDVFRFERRDGKDVILDFETRDRLDFSDHAAAKGYRALMRQAEDTRKGALLDVGPDEVLLRGVELDALSRNDFVF